MSRIHEKFLSSILLGISILLGLSFWLNIRFNFNIFSKYHWHELARLQVSHTPIDSAFYISIGIALFLFILGLYMIFKPRFRKISLQQNNIAPSEPVIKQSATENQKTTSSNPVMPQQPPRLNLPKNMAAVAAQQHQINMTQNATTPQSGKTESNRVTIYDNQLSQIFSDAQYLVKPNIYINGFKSNLFAIGHDEILWIGAVDCDINLFKTALEKLKAIFAETLEDIPITVYPFILDNKRIYDSDEDILVFHDIKDITNTLSQNPNPKTPDMDQENFDAYSDYIDTIIQYFKNT